jgi:hypothetical protein
VIIRSFYNVGDRIELARDLSVSGRPADMGEALSPGFFAGTPERHVFVVPSPRGPCLGFDGHLVILDAGTQLALQATDRGRVLTVRRGSEPVAQLPAPQPDDHIDANDEMNDFFVWLAGRFNRPDARAAYTSRG